MNRILVSLTAFFLYHSAFSQAEKIKARLFTNDSASLKIIHVYPDSFPNIAVVFKAETFKGEPLWNLTKNRVQVKEDLASCRIISLEQLSKNKTINIGVVLDHSGSMAEDRNKLFDKQGNALYTFDAGFNIIFPQGYIAPIDNAKKAVKAFARSFNAKKDFISITGFASEVDAELPLTQNAEQINRIVDSMQAGATTALYDAIISSISKIKNADGVKVLVALTDGQDNSSAKTLEEVIKTARTESIPVYVIGLGDVNKDSLAYIAAATNGHFFYTRSAASLDSIYAAISQQVQAFYNLVYASGNFSPADSLRQVMISFDIDSLYLATAPDTLKLPREIIQYLETKEKKKELMVYGGIASVILLAAGVLLYTYRKRKKQLHVITKIYPNPSRGIIHIDFTGEPEVVVITDMNGQQLKNFSISASGQQFDLSSLKNGIYFATLRSGNTQSNTVKFMIAGN